MTRFDDYADAVLEQHADFMLMVAAGVVPHDRPLTRDQAREDAAAERERRVRLADLFDNDNPDSLWYDGEVGG